MHLQGLDVERQILKIMTIASPEPKAAEKE